MKNLSRRSVLQALAVAPVAILTWRPSSAAPPALSVEAAMRYLCEEVFPSAHQREAYLIGARHGC